MGFYFWYSENLTNGNIDYVISILRSLTTPETFSWYQKINISLKFKDSLNSPLFVWTLRMSEFEVSISSCACLYMVNTCIYLHITLHTCCKKWINGTNSYTHSKINKLYRTNDIQSFHNENRIAKKKRLYSTDLNGKSQNEAEKKII